MSRGEYSSVTSSMEFTIQEGAALGQQLRIATPTGKELLLAIPPGAHPGQLMRAEVPQRGAREDWPLRQQARRVQKPARRNLCLQQLRCHGSPRQKTVRR